MKNSIRKSDEKDIEIKMNPKIDRTFEILSWDGGRRTWTKVDRHLQLTSCFAGLPIYYYYWKSYKFNGYNYLIDDDALRFRKSRERHRNEKYIFLNFKLNFVSSRKCL